MIELDIALFRSQLTAFSDPLLHSDAIIAVNWDLATCYISPTCGGALNDNCRAYAINLATAHILTLKKHLTEDAPASGQVNAASEGTVSVSLTLPESKTAFQFWLNKTPYGQELHALLKAKGSVGFYIGGSSITQTYRKPSGKFGR